MSLESQAERWIGKNEYHRNGREGHVMGKVKDALVLFQKEHHFVRGLPAFDRSSFW